MLQGSVSGHRWDAGPLARRGYVVAQLQAFASGARRNDSPAQMRNLARAMTPREIKEVAAF